MYWVTCTREGIDKVLQDSSLVESWRSIDYGEGHNSQNHHYRITNFIVWESRVLVEIYFAPIKLKIKIRVVNSYACLLLYSMLPPKNVHIHV